MRVFWGLIFILIAATAGFLLVSPSSDDQASAPQAPGTPAATPAPAPREPAARQLAAADPGPTAQQPGESRPDPEPAPSEPARTAPSGAARGTAAGLSIASTPEGALEAGAGEDASEQAENAVVGDLRDRAPSNSPAERTAQTERTEQADARPAAEAEAEPEAASPPAAVASGDAQPAPADTIERIETATAAADTSTGAMSDEPAPAEPIETASAPADEAAKTQAPGFGEALADLIEKNRSNEAEPAADAEAADTEAADAATTFIAEDGALTIDGEAIAGGGTANDPYVLPWSILVSAQDVYQPRLGKTELPRWASLLEGKHVRLSGYILLPQGSTSFNELLLMMNQWDGCCIGVPPSPYDAIEVRLARPIDPIASGISATVSSYGQITGVLDVDPYLAGGWLLGLYLMEDASVSVFGAAATP